MVQVRDYDNARRLLTQPAHYALVPLSTCVLLAVRRLNEHILKRAAWKTDHAQRPSEKAAGTDGCVTEVPGGRVPDDVDRLSCQRSRNSPTLRGCPSRNSSTPAVT